VNTKRWLWNTLGVALLVAVALSCSSSKAPPDPAAELRAGIDEIVADEARAATMLAAVDQIEAAAAEADRLFAEERAALVPLIRDHGSSREAIERSLADFNARHESLARRFLAAHASLKAQATAAEWQELRKLEMSMIRFAASQSVGEAAPAEKEG
jgi:cell division septum initiation protein DivIVA